MRISKFILEFILETDCAFNNYLCKINDHEIIRISWKFIFFMFMDYL